MDERLALAFDLAAGREAPGAEALPAALLAFAGRVVEAGRRAFAAPPVPAAVLRRAAEIPEARPRGRRLAEAVLALLFDSWAGAVPVLRGAGRTRFLRYGDGVRRLDVGLATDPDGTVRLRGTLDGVEGPAVLAVGAGRARVAGARVRAGGSFSVVVPPGTGPFTLAVRRGGRTVLRTGTIPPGTP